jgi:hypothetical protein
MNGDAMDNVQLVLMVLQGLLTLVGILIAFQVKRLYQTVDALSGKDSQLEKLIVDHREDVLKSYASAIELVGLRDEFTKRFDRFEDNIMNAIRRIPAQ